MTVAGWIGAIIVGGALIVGALIWLAIATGQENVRLSQDVENLIEIAEELGLPDRDVANATEMLENAEFGEAFEIIVTQIHECNISISAGYYQLIQTVAEKLKLPEQEYIFTKKLIK